MPHRSTQPRSFPGARFRFLELAPASLAGLSTFVQVASLVGLIGLAGCVQGDSPRVEPSRLTVHYAHPVDEVDCAPPTCRVARVQGVLGRPEPIALIEDAAFRAPQGSLVRVEVEQRPSTHAAGEMAWVPLVFLDEASQQAVWPVFNDLEQRPGRVIAAVSIDGRAIVSVTRGTLPSPIELGEYTSPEQAHEVVASLEMPIAPAASTSASLAAEPGGAAPESDTGADRLGDAGVSGAPDDETLRRLEAFEARLESEEEDPEVIARELQEFLGGRAVAVEVEVEVD